jgi:hypothetical protein
VLATPLLAALVAVGTMVPAPATGATTWSRNLWVPSAFLYQDPYYTACTAAAAMFMLNTIAYRDTGGNGFTWRPYRVKSNKADRRLPT